MGEALSVAKRRLTAELDPMALLLDLTQTLDTVASLANTAWFQLYASEARLARTRVGVSGSKQQQQQQRHQQKLGGRAPLPGVQIAMMAFGKSAAIAPRDAARFVGEYASEAVHRLVGGARGGLEALRTLAQSSVAALEEQLFEL